MTEITIHDVARLAGVSASTVSRVLTGRRPVSPNLHDRVLSAASQLGYAPNVRAKSLREGRSLTIGLVLTDVSNPFLASVMRGVQDVVETEGYSVAVGNTDDDPQQEAACLQSLLAQRAEGMIIVPSGTTNDEVDRLRANARAVVYVERVPPGVDGHAVVLDNEAGASLAIEHLISHGHRRVGMVTGQPGVSPFTDLASAYVRAHNSAQLAADTSLVARCGPDIDDAMLAALKLLDLDEPPTAIFAASNHATIGVLEAASRRGVRIPQDLAFVASFDFWWSFYLRPQLTTVARPMHEIGRVAARLLLQQLAGGVARPPQRVVLSPKLVIRESCGCPKGDLPRLDVAWP